MKCGTISPKWKKWKLYIPRTQLQRSYALPWYFLEIYGFLRNPALAGYLEGIVRSASWHLRQQHGCQPSWQISPRLFFGSHSRSLFRSGQVIRARQRVSLPWRQCFANALHWSAVANWIAILNIAIVLCWAGGRRALYREAKPMATIVVLQQANLDGVRRE